MRLLRKSIAYIIFIVFFTAFFLLNDVLNNYIMKLELINSYNNTPYNDHAITFLIESYEGTTLELSGIESLQLLEGCVLLKYNPQKNTMHEVIYCDKEAIEITDSYISEDQWTFLSGEKIAVVGCSSSYSLGENVYNDGFTYVVSGVLEEHISDAVNYGIFYSNCDLREIDEQSGYVLTSNNPGNVKRAYKELINWLEEKNIAIKVIDIRNAEFSDFIEYNRMLDYLMICIVIFYVIFIYVIRLIWLRIKREEIFVLTILGYKYVKEKLYLQYISLWGISFILSSIFFLLLNENFYYGYLSVFRLSAAVLLIALLSTFKMYRNAKYLM